MMLVARDDAGRTWSVPQTSCPAVGVHHCSKSRGMWLRSRVKSFDRSRYAVRRSTCRGAHVSSPASDRRYFGAPGRHTACTRPLTRKDHAARLGRECGRRGPQSRPPPTGTITAWTFSPVCRCSRARTRPSISRWANGGSASRTTGLRNVAGMVRGRDPCSRHGPAMRADGSRRIADFLLGDETLTPPFPGLLRYVAWTATARFLRPVVNAFGGWRDEDRLAVRIRARAASVIEARVYRWLHGAVRLSP